MRTADQQHRSTGRRGVRTALVVAVTALVAAPLGAWAGDSFSDVPDSNIFHDDIDWMAENGVTSGCGGDRFCPSDTVTREQMSAFMRRLDSQDVFSTPDEVDAAIDSATSGPVDADTLDGLNSTAFLRSNATAADADELGGLAPEAYRTRFAVFSYNLSVFSTLNEHGLTGATRTGPGEYVLQWDESVRNCAWVATSGARNGGTPAANYTFGLSSSNAVGGDRIINVRVRSSAGALTDSSFSIAVNC